MPKIAVDLEKCTGCRTCELVCSFERSGVFNPKKSAIRVVKEDLMGLDGPLVCQFCRNPQCVAACPEGALAKDPTLGFITVDETKCTGCRLCEEACPFGAVSFHPEVDKPIICNLCGGKPACVEWCDVGALAFSSAKSAEGVQAKRLKTLLTQFGPILKKWNIYPDPNPGKEEAR
jgi:carbon-monoxide dehydrogenase iron sulfur subunit